MRQIHSGKPANRRGEGKTESYISSREWLFVTWWLRGVTEKETPRPELNGCFIRKYAQTQIEKVVSCTTRVDIRTDGDIKIQGDINIESDTDTHKHTRRTDKHISQHPLLTFPVSLPAPDRLHLDLNCTAQPAAPALHHRPDLIIPLPRPLYAGHRDPY